MATNKPIELYFVHPIYARGEHVVGQNALTDDGKINMVRIGRGDLAKIHFDAARDLIIAKQAIDNRNASATDRAEAKAFVEDCKRKEDRMLAAQTEAKESETDLKTQIAQLRQEVAKLQKKAA